MDIAFSPVIQWINNIRDFGLEYASRRYYGLYKGKVDSNIDLSQQGKITVCVGDLGFGFQSPTGLFTPSPLELQAYPGAGYAGLDHGIYFPPEIGDTVWVSFDHGDPSQPRYHGGWWCNDDPAKNPAGSHVPAEFKNVGIPLSRGIKTRRGHGIRFKDDPTDPLLELWTGEQTSPHVEAIKKHRIIMSDNPGNSFVRVRTFGNRMYEADDTLQTVTIRGAPLGGEADPSGELAHSMVIDDILGTIETKSRLQQRVTIDDPLLTTTIDTPGTVLVGGVAGVAISAGAPATVPPIPGAYTETGQGVKITNFVGAVTETIGGLVTRTITGAVTETFVGAVTQTIGGALTQTVAGAVTQTVGGILNQTVTGLWNMTTTSATVATTDQSHPVIPAVTLGSVGGLKLLLVQEGFIDAYNTHTHTSGAPGAPTSPPVEQIVPPSNPLSTPPDPAVAAPNIDRRTVLTEYVQAD